MITTIIKKIYRRFKLVNMPLFVSVCVFKKCLGKIIKNPNLYIKRKYTRLVNENFHQRSTTLF